MSGSTTTNAQSPLGPLMLDLQGLELSAEEATLITNPTVGGVIFFTRNFQSVEQLMALVAEIRALRPNLLLAVDQEGGRVQRLKDGFTLLPPMQAFLNSYREDPHLSAQLLQDVGWLMAVEILAMGIDFSFAPVLDVDDCHCSVIADRSFSPEPNEVAEMAGYFIDGMHEAGMAATGKHYPGHGMVAADSHLELPIDERPYDEIWQRDLVPFTKLQSRLDAVMPAHILFPNVDSQPVGFSRCWLQQKLRVDMGYEGVIFSDDLTMAGAHCAGGYGERAELALKAGCDMVLVCNHREGALEALAHLEALDLPFSRRLDAMSATARLANVQSAAGPWNLDRLQQNLRWISTKTRLATMLEAK